MSRREMLSFLMHNNYNMKIFATTTYPRVIFAVTVLLMPNVTSAFTLSQVLGYFNIVIGLFLTASVLSYAIGVIIWATRYGTWPREEGFPFMQFGITTLFVLSVLLALINWLLKHTSTTLYVISFILVVLCGIFILYAVRGKKKEEAPYGPPRPPGR